MSTIPTFDYDKFIGLAGPEVAIYMDPWFAAIYGEPSVRDPTTKVPKEVLERMLLALPTYDIYHLLPALELGAAQSPEIFALHIPQYLGHENASVSCAAFRVLSNLPDEYVTQALLESVQRVPVGKKCFTEPFDGTKHFVGTNSTFIKELLAQFRKRLQEKGE